MRGREAQRKRKFCRDGERKETRTRNRRDTGTAHIVVLGFEVGALVQQLARDGLVATRARRPEASLALERRRAARA